MNKLKIVKVIDQYGWAYYFGNLCQIKYSEHDIQSISITDYFNYMAEITNPKKPYNKEIMFPDIVYFHGVDMHLAKQTYIINTLRSLSYKTKIIGAYGGQSKLSYPDADLILSVSLKHMTWLKDNYSKTPVVYFPQGVDSQYFKYNKPKKDRFVVGWAGRPHPVKRYDLLDKLKYPVVKQEKWGKEFFKKGRNLEEMKEFYKSIDVLILPSVSEAQPRVVMEAMASGLPVIATDVGSLSLILEPRWLVPNTTDAEIKDAINHRLDDLKENYSLRQSVGLRNSAFIEKHLNYKNLMPIWDKMFTDLMRKNYKDIIKASDDYLINFSDKVDIVPYRGVSRTKSVAKVIDQFGWAFYFIAKEMKKYSDLDICYQKWNEIKYNTDILLLSGVKIHSSLNNTAIPLAKEKGLKVIGQYSGQREELYPYADLIVAISPQTYSFCKKSYESTPVVFLPESIDAEFFIPKESNHTDFKVGWAGRDEREIKRCYLLDKLNYPVIKQSKWGLQFFKDGREQKEMLDFYHSINCLVLTSTTECQPRVVMEAMACGLPVISTYVGSIPLLLDKEWIVPVYPEDELLEQMNKKLELLATNPELQKKVGERNRQHVLKYFSWEKNISLWDSTFIHLLNNETDKIIEVSENFLLPFKKEFNEAIVKYEFEKLNPPSKIIKQLNLKGDSKPEKIKTILKWMCSNNIYFWLTGESGKDIKNGKFPAEKLFINLENEKTKDYILEKFTNCNDVIEFTIHNHPTLTKIILDGLTIRIPYDLYYAK